MAAKRPASDGAGPANAKKEDGPPAKKKMTTFEPIKIGSIATLEELDVKVLQFQNKKLCERIEARRKAENDLRNRIEQLEQRQTTDDAVMCIVNRYWNQLDEDVRVLLQRFDAEGADESEKKNESSAVTSFLTLLSQWDKQEIEEKLHQRVEFSKRAIGKLLQAYDRLLQRNEKMRSSVQDKILNKDSDTDTETKTEDELDIKLELDPDVKIKKEPPEPEEKASETKPEVSDAAKDGEVAEDTKNIKIKQEPEVEVKKEKEGEETKTEEKMPTVDEVFLKEMDHLRKENKRLHDLVTELHQNCHELNIKNSELSDKSTAAETEAAELKNKVEELEYDLENANAKVDKYDRHLADAMSKIKTYEEGDIRVAGGGEGVSRNKFEEIYRELEEQKELATNRLGELENLQKEHQEALKEIEQLKMDLSQLPEHVIVETTDYKCLQSQFSVLYNESLQMKTQLEDNRNLLQTSKNAYLRQIEEMEGAELEGQKKLRTDFIQLEDQLSQVRREYEMLRIEFEQTLAANEQTGPINREMRNLITSLKNHNEQLKGEVARYKRKLKEAHTEIGKLQASRDEHESKCKLGTPSTPAPTTSDDTPSLSDPPNIQHHQSESILTKSPSQVPSEFESRDSPRRGLSILVLESISPDVPPASPVTLIQDWHELGPYDPNDTLNIVSTKIIPLEPTCDDLQDPRLKKKRSPKKKKSPDRKKSPDKKKSSSKKKSPTKVKSVVKLKSLEKAASATEIKQESPEKSSKSKSTSDLEAGEIPDCGRPDKGADDRVRSSHKSPRRSDRSPRRADKSPRRGGSDRRGRQVEYGPWLQVTGGSGPPRSYKEECELHLSMSKASSAHTGGDRSSQTGESSKLKSEQPLTEPAGVKPKSEEESEPPAPITRIADEPLLLKKEEDEKEEKEREKGKTEAEIIKDLKIQLKKSQDSQRDMKLLLDMYKSVPKETRDKVQLMAGEKQAKVEIEELKSHIRKMQEAERKERRKLAEEDAIRKIKKMEETIQELQKNLAAQKQEEEALLNEMEVTGQAFEDMQEQNIRLLQQLKEKDDANFKLMSERIKSNQIAKLLREEKEVLAEQATTLALQVEAQNQVVRKLEDKERILQNNLATVEKELVLRTQASELQKRKAVENSQTAADLKLHLDKYHSQLKEAQTIVAEKTSTLSQEGFKHRRIHEEVASLRRKLERAKKIEMASSADEVLLEEIREYKEQLTCPSCKVKKKDAVLTKCFHVFCLECLKTRYETRQRKCPKCNATFGANDYHRLYLS